MEHPEARRGTLVGLVTYIVWGLLTVYWKQLHRFDAFELIGWRVSTSAVVMVAILSVRRRWRALGEARRAPGTMPRLVIAAVALTVNWTGYVWAVVHGHVLQTALGYFTAPLLATLVGVVVLGERLRPAQVAAVVLAAAALVVLTVTSGELPWLAVLIAVSWTAYSYLKRQLTMAPVESMAVESFVLVVPAVALLAWRSTAPGSVVHHATAWQFTLVLLTGVVTVAPLMSFAYAAQRVPLSSLGPLQYSVPTINFLLGWIAYDEPVSTSRWIGFGLVWLGLGLVALDSWRRARRPGASVPAPSGGH